MLIKLRIEISLVKFYDELRIHVIEKMVVTPRFYKKRK
jgi:hypothetical protein